MQFRTQTILSMAMSAAVAAAAVGCSGSGSPTAPSPTPEATQTGAVIAGVATGSTGGLTTTGAGGGLLAVETAGLMVTVVGTDRSAMVNSDGLFELNDVPAGDRQLQFAGDGVNATVTVGSVARDQFIELRVQVGASSAAILEEVRTAKVALCHRSEDARYHGIEISVSAEAAHRAHGDGAVGESVPGDPLEVFNSDCQPVGPSVKIEKTTNGNDADDAPGPELTLGTEVFWVYTVTNDGATPLTNIAVVDDQGVTVDCGTPHDLAPGAAMTCSASGLVTELGQYSNIGTVTADWSSAAGSGSVNDSDASHYFGISPLTIEKLTNGDDADFAPGPTVAVGALVTWEYIVTNIGTVDLTEVAVEDDQGVVVSCSATTLAPQASMTCTGSGVAVAGQYANVGTATATWNAVTSAGPVTGPAGASDPSHYFGGDEEEGPKVTLCHKTGAGFYVLINVGIAAEPAHLAHGDGKPGEAVPGLPGQSFTASCGVQ